MSSILKKENTSAKCYYDVLNLIITGMPSIL